MVVHTFMLGDWMTSMQSRITYLLESGMKMLVYSGDKDFICNWRGGEAWTNAANWTHADEFRAAQYVDWKESE